jgi:hypothetical protein
MRPVGVKENRARKEEDVRATPFPIPVLDQCLIKKSGASSAAKAVLVTQSEFRTTLRLAFHAFVFSFVFNVVMIANV